MKPFITAKTTLKRMLLSILLPAAMATVPTMFASAQSLPLTMRVASYNIRHGEGMDGKLDYLRIADVLKKLNPDVVAVEEVDSMTRRTNHTYSLGEIASHMRYHESYAPAIDYEGGKYGIGILSRVRPIRTSQYTLPGRDEARTLLVAEFDNYVFACTHLSLAADERMESLKTIEKVAAKYDKPFIIAGDWNDHPDSPFIKALKQNFQICSRLAPSYPADKPNECLDYIAVYNTGKSVVAKHSRVVDEPVASDHRPIFAEIAISTQR